MKLNQPEQEKSLPKVAFVVTVSVCIGYIIGLVTNYTQPDPYLNQNSAALFKAELINEKNIKLFADRIDVTNIERHLK